MPLTSRRVLAASIGVLAVAMMTMAACKPPHRPPPTTSTTSTTSIGTVPGAVDCGTLVYDTTGTRTTGPNDLAAQTTCLRNALDAGHPAHFVTVDVPGDPGTVTWDVLGAGQLRVTSANLVQLCTNLSTSTWDGRPALLAGNCTPQPPAAPPLAGKDCGTISYASGWPTTMLVNLEFGAGKCFLDAWAAGTPARVVTRETTDNDGYHIRIVTYDVLGRGQLRVVTDDRQTLAGGGVTTERCTALTASTSTLQPGNCSPA